MRVRRSARESILERTTLSFSNWRTPSPHLDRGQCSSSTRYVCMYVCTYVCMYVIQRQHRMHKNNRPGGPNRTKLKGTVNKKQN